MILVSLKRTRVIKIKDVYIVQEKRWFRWVDMDYAQLSGNVKGTLKTTRKKYAIEIMVSEERRYYRSRNGEIEMFVYLILAASVLFLAGYGISRVFPWSPTAQSIYSVFSIIALLPLVWVLAKIKETGVKLWKR